MPARRAFYQGDPSLRAALSLGRHEAGAFHPRFPAAIELTVEPDRLHLDDRVVAWTPPLQDAYVEVDVASLTHQQVTVGASVHDVAPGAATIAVPVTLGQPVRMSGAPETLALRRLRVRASPAEPAVQPGPGALVGSAAVDISGSRLIVRAAVAGAGRLALEVRGAAAYDDRPVRLVSGSQPVTTGTVLVFDIDLLTPAAAWLAGSEPPVDGRYIAYLRDPALPGSTGVPVGKFNIRQGRVVDAEPVPLPLTVLQ